jgi:Carboxypeptidase regulatory-like domain
VSVDCKKNRQSLGLGRRLTIGLVVLGLVFPAVAKSQQKAAPQSSASLPSAPIQAGGGANAQQSDSQSFGTIRGKVVDQSGAPITGAQVTLYRKDQTQELRTETDNAGLFFFANLVPGLLQLTFASEGLTGQTIHETIGAGQSLTVPDVVLIVATQVTEVRVGVTPAEEAQDEVKEAEKQRVFGLIPNFFVTYDPHPVPLTPTLKFRLAWKSSVDPFTLLAIGAVAGVEQATNRWPGYGQGAQGYAKRYGASYGDVFIGTFIGGAVLPSLLKQDPRYFYQGTGSKKSRLLHALGSSVICRGDNGKLEPNFSNIGGAFAAGGLASLYAAPGSRNDAQAIVSTALIRIGETTVASIFQEFIIRKVTPSARNRAQTQP